MRTWVLPLILVAEIAFFTLLGETRFSSLADFARYFSSYFADLIAQSAPVLLLAFGMTLVLMTGGIDLSVGSTTALVACVMACFPANETFWFTALPAGLLLALALGFTNGALITWLDVPPIIATLGSMIFYRGLCFVVLADLEKAPFLDVPGYTVLGQFAGTALLVAVAYLGVGSWLRCSRWQREVLMLGGNPVAARYAAVPIQRRLLQIYLLLGLLAFLAALSFTARNSSVSASSLTGLELRVIVAVVLGGTRVQGGSGSLIGTFFGVFLIAVLDEGLRGAAVWGQTHLPFKLSHLEYVLLGLLLLGGVWANARNVQRSIQR